LVADDSTTNKRAETARRTRSVLMGSPSDVEGALARVKKSGRGAKERAKKGRREPGEERGFEQTPAI